MCTLPNMDIPTVLLLVSCSSQRLFWCIRGRPHCFPAFKIVYFWHISNTTIRQFKQCWCQGNIETHATWSKLTIIIFYVVISTYSSGSPLTATFHKWELSWSAVKNCKFMWFLYTSESMVVFWVTTSRTSMTLYLFAKLGKGRVTCLYPFH